ncbi:ATPase [Halorubrum sp. DTA46]|uniref:ATPase n=1 Tax=Halorubrum sp. DTA46 TaxID=3402162 RepID=UPI003AAF3AEE
MTETRSDDPPVLLVAGGDRVDAGKTTFSTGLVASLAANRGDAIGVKPLAGNDYWFDHDDYRIATDSGRLYGKDARRLAAASTRSLSESAPGEDSHESDRRADERGSDRVDDCRNRAEVVTPESVNPVHRLWRPTPGRTGLLGDTDRTFLCDRVTTPDGDRFVVNGAAEAEGLISDGLADRLPLRDAVRVDGVEGLNEAMAVDHLSAFDRLAEHIAATRTPVVVESYADIADPLPREGPVEPDAVAVVDPGRAQIYAGDRYAKARAVASGSPREGALEEHTGTVTEMIEPLSTVALPALASDERTDPTRVADRYNAAYEALVAAL